MSSLPQHLTLVDHVVATAEALVQSFAPPVFPSLETHSDDDFYLSTRRISTDSHVISIWGDRGSGKSTVLARALHKLRNDPRFFVLPPLSPELFGPGDTLVNVVLAAIYRDHEAIAESGPTDEFIELLQRARRSCAVHAVPLERLVTASSSVAEFAREVQNVAGSTEHMWRDAQRVLTACAALRPGRRAVVISVDDSDLVGSARLVDLVRQVRVLGSFDHTVLLVVGRKQDLLSQLVREIRAEQQANFKEYDLEIEKDIRRSVADQMPKVFPLWGEHRVPRPSIQDRLAFSPEDVRADTRAPANTLAQQVAAFDAKLTTVGQPPDLSTRALALDDESALQLWERGIGDLPLPHNARILTQIWHALDHALYATWSNEGSAKPLVDWLSTLVASIHEPYGIDRPLKFDWVWRQTQSGGPQEAQTRVDFDGIYASVYAGPWRQLDRPTRHIEHGSAERGVVFDLRPCTNMISRWRVSSPSVPDYEDDGWPLSLLLAVQGFLADAANLQLTEDSLFTYGVGISTQTYLQDISFYGRCKDDHFIMFPMTPTLRSTVQAITAWNTIVDRATQDELSLRQVLALLLHATTDIFVDQRPANVATAPTDYAGALARVEQTVRACLPLVGSNTTGLGLVQHFLAWYQRWVPAHWHESLFGQEEIRSFCVTYDELSGGLWWGVPAGGYRSVSLFERLRKQVEASGRTEDVEKNAWFGGYATVVDVMQLTMPTTWDMVRNAWRRVVAAPLLGQASIESAGATEPRRAPRPLSRPTARDSEQGRALVDYAVARLRAWANS
jgi:hypothetical protein